MSSFVGQALIAVPVLGAVIGNTIDIIRYRTVASSVPKRKNELIEPNLDEQPFLDEQLAAEHQELIQELEESVSDYLGLLEQGLLTRHADHPPRIIRIGTTTRRANRRNLGLRRKDRRLLPRLIASDMGLSKSGPQVSCHDSEPHQERLRLPILRWQEGDPGGQRLGDSLPGHRGHARRCQPGHHSPRLTSSTSMVLS